MFPRPMSVYKTIEDIVPELAGGAVHGQASTQSSHLIHKIHETQIEVIFDQGKRAQADAFTGAAVHFLQCSTSGAFAGRVNQDEITALEVSGRLAVGDADDLFVAGRLPVQHMASAAETGLDVGEVLRHASF